MKEYKITIKITSEKEVIARANSAKEAAEMGAELCSSNKNVSKRSPKRLAPWST